MPIKITPKLQIQHEWHKSRYASSPLNIPLNNTSSYSALLLTHELLFWKFCSCLLLLFSSHISLVVTTRKRATVHGLASIEQNIKSPPANRDLFPQNKRLLTYKFFTALVFGKMLFW